MGFRWMALAFGIPFFLLSILGIGALGFLVVRFRKRLSQISDTKLARIGKLREGTRRVKGRILAREELLSSPLEARECVYYRLRVDEQRTVTHGRSVRTVWHTVIDETETIDVVVKDETGEATVSLDQAEVVLRDVKFTFSSILKDPPARLQRHLREKHGRSHKEAWFNKTMRYTETVLEDNTPVIVVGEVELHKGKKPLFVGGDNPLIVTDKSKDELSGHYRTRIFWSYAGIVVLSVFVLGLATILIGAGWWADRLVEGVTGGDGQAERERQEQAAREQHARQAEVTECVQLLKGADPGKRQTAAERLGRMPLLPNRRDEVAQALDPLLAPTNPPATRTAAAFALKTWVTKQNQWSLIKMLQRQEPYYLDVIAALGQINDKPAGDALAAELDNAPRRSEVLAALRHQPSAEFCVTGRLRSATDPQTRIMLCGVLKEIGYTMSAAVLEEIVKNPNDPARAAALDALQVVKTRK